MDIITVKEKIRKLLALSQSDNENESYAALTKAQELMVEYKIHESEISPASAKKKCIHKQTEFSYGTRSTNHYLNSLAEIISENFCCINYLSTLPGKSTHYINFMGTEDDVSLCEDAMRVSSTAIVDGYNRVWRDLQLDYHRSYIPTSVWNPAKLGYIKGYLHGLDEVFKEQRSQHQEWGLVLVVPQEAQEYEKSLELANFHQKSVRPDNYYYLDGYNDGKDFHMNKKISGDALLQLN